MSDNQQVMASLRAELARVQARVVELERVAERRERYDDDTYRGLLESLDAGVVVHAPDTSIRVVNPAACRLLGLSEAQLLGREAMDPGWRFLREDGSEMPRSEFPVNRVLAGEDPLRSLTAGVRQPAGSGAEQVVWLLVNGFAARDEAGELRDVVINFVDVTEHQLATERLRRAEQKWRNVLVNTPQIGVILDRQARIVFANRHLLQLTGWSEAEVLGGEWFELFIPEELRPTVRQVFAATMRADDPLLVSTFENDIITRSGEPRHVAWANVLSQDEHGEIVDVTCFGVDLTERVELEGALRRSEAKYRQMAELMPQALWETDATGRFTYVNRAGYELIGLEPEDLEGELSFVEVIDGVDLPRALQNFGTELDSPGRSGDNEYICRRRDGSTFPALIFSAPIRDGDQLLGVRGITLDISDRRERERLQEQLQQAQKMEAIGRLAGGVAHDFNNILCTIGINAELALEELAPGEPLRESVSEISSAADRAAELTRQLLAFSRKQVIDPKVINLAGLVERLRSMLSRLIGEHVILRTTSCDDLGWVRADPGQIEQVVVNLAVNARDAMPEGGELLIETRNVELEGLCCDNCDDHVQGPFVALRVSDTGCGMTAEVRERVFEPFYTTKELGRGTGLGLATVFGIVEQAEGHIHVTSTPGEGSCFEIYLPRVRGEAEERTRNEPAVMSGGAETVLVVEDEGLVRELARRVLEDLGYRVLAAAGGAEALALAARTEGPIDLLLTDVVMPQMNGKQLAAKLTAARPETRVLFTSGYTGEVIAQHGVLEGGVQFLPKPYTRQSLAARVRRVLDAG